jgi:hypothetical protein
MLVRIRLVRKLAQRLNGVDVSDVNVGDCLDLSPESARLLIEEGWAVLVDRLHPEDREERQNP